MRILADFHDEKTARQARDEFQRIFVEKKAPDEVAEHRIPAGDGKIFLPKLLVSLGLASSNTEAMRLIRQGGVKLDDETVASDTRDIRATPGEMRLVKVGKRRFARVIFK